MKVLRRLVVASQNPDKIAEIEAVLADLPVPPEVVRGLSLEPVAERHRDNVVRLAARYFPVLAGDRARFEAVLTLVTNAMHGMVASRRVHGERPTAEREQLSLLTQAVTALIASQAALQEGVAGGRGPRAGETS